MGMALILFYLPATAFAINQWTWHLAEKHQHKEGVNTVTYLSQPFDLSPGQFIYTDEDETPVSFPNAGPYAITGFQGEVVYADTNESVPLSKVYDHHWIVTHTGFVNRLCKNGPTYTFGIGAESRKTPVNFPSGYGYRVADPNMYWGANIHCLRTEYLAGDDQYVAAKECNECYYAPGKGCLPHQNGTFECCGDGHDIPGISFGCPVRDDAPSDAVSYRLRYTLRYTEYFAVKPAEIGVITTPNCATFYQVSRDDANPEHLTSTTFKAPYDLEILVAIGHQHVGALNISLFVNDVLACASYPRYGTQLDVAGNERGYLVEMSTCFQKDENSSLIIKKHDLVRLDSWYWVSDDPRIDPLPGGTHLNVMGYMYIVFASDSNRAIGEAWRTL